MQWSCALSFCFPLASSVWFSKNVAPLLKPVNHSTSDMVQPVTAAPTTSPGTQKRFSAFLLAHKHICLRAFACIVFSSWNASPPYPQISMLTPSVVPAAQMSPLQRGLLQPLTLCTQYDFSVDAWMERWMDGWEIDGWMDGWRQSVPQKVCKSLRRSNMSMWGFRIMNGAWWLHSYGRDGYEETEGLEGAEGPSQVLDWRTGWIQEEGNLFEGKQEWSENKFKKSII